MKTVPAIRSQDELQRAHDLLGAMIMLDDSLFTLVFHLEQKERLMAALDVLCWALHHDHNKAFAENLKAIEKRMRMLGFKLKQSREYFTAKEGPTE